MGKIGRDELLLIGRDALLRLGRDEFLLVRSVGRKSRREFHLANKFDGIAPDLSRLACVVSSPLISRNAAFSS
jgi:hypothetical protein